MGKRCGRCTVPSYPAFAAGGVSGDDAEAVHYRRLVELLHPAGLACPRCGGADGLRVHRRRRQPVVDYLCTRCFSVFNAWTGTILQGTHRLPSEVLYILHCMRLGVATSLIARELDCGRSNLIAFKRRLPPLLRAWALT